jgi:hypothetical protein
VRPPVLGGRALPVDRRAGDDQPPQRPCVECSAGRFPAPPASGPAGRLAAHRRHLPGRKRGSALLVADELLPVRANATRLYGAGMARRRLRDARLRPWARRSARQPRGSTPDPSGPAEHRPVATVSPPTRRLVRPSGGEPGDRHHWDRAAALGRGRGTGPDDGDHRGGRRRAGPPRPHHALHRGGRHGRGPGAGVGAGHAPRLPAADDRRGRDVRTTRRSRRRDSDRARSGLARGASDLAGDAGQPRGGATGDSVVRGGRSVGGCGADARPGHPPAVATAAGRWAAIGIGCRAQRASRLCGRGGGRGRRGRRPGSGVERGTGRARKRRGRAGPRTACGGGCPVGPESARAAGRVGKPGPGWRSPSSGVPGRPAGGPQDRGRPGTCSS